MQKDESIIFLLGVQLQLSKSFFCAYFFFEMKQKTQDEKWIEFLNKEATQCLITDDDYIVILNNDTVYQRYIKSMNNIIDMGFFTKTKEILISKMRCIFVL